MPLRKYSSVRASDNSVHSNGFVIPRGTVSGGKQVIPPPNDGFHYLASGGDNGEGFWTGPFYLNRTVANGQPASFFTLRMDVDSATTYPMFEEQQENGT